ncbi:MAG: hypothetical protein SPH53_05140, partial [Bacteroidaceae bacterium]|nr:hypothetical protein [Bacteroidaceae bacterium]
TMFSGLKFHVFTPHSDAFSRFLGSFAQNRFSLFDANLEGNVWYDGQFGGRKWRKQGPTDGSRGGYMQGFPRA